MSEFDPAQQAVLTQVPEAESPASFILADVFAPGHGIEKNPVPIGTVAINVASPEDVLTTIEPGATAAEAGPDSPRWLPYIFETDNPTDIALTDEENQTLTDLLAKGGALKIRGYGQPTDETPATTASAEDQDTGLTIRTKVAIAASTVGVTAVGLLSMFSPARAKAADGGTPFGQGNIPGLTGNLLGNQQDLGSDQASISTAETARASASDPSLEQECIKAGAAAPKILKWPTMIHAGMHSEPTHSAQHHPGQALEGLFQYSALEPPLTSADCAPDYLREVGGKFFMEKVDVHGNPGNPIKNPNKWTDISGGWPLASIPNAEGELSRNQNQAATVHINRATGTFFNQCINGKFLRVDYVNKNVVTDGQTGQQLDETYHIYHAKVRGNCKAAAKSARVAANTTN